MRASSSSSSSSSSVSSSSVPAFVLKAVAFGASASFLIALSLCGGTTIVATTASCDPGPDSGSSDAEAGATSSSSGVATSPNQPRSIDYRTLCNRLINECAQPTTSAECNKSYQHLLVSGACNTQIATAPCADLTTPRSTVLNVCFPPCTAQTSTAKCNADNTLTLCSQAGATLLADCQLSCAADGFNSYTGTCGTKYKDQIAAQDQCWCE